MDSVQSFRGYDKVNELEQADFRKKTRKRIVIVSLSLLLFAGLVVGIVAGTIAHNKKNKSGDSPANQNSAAIRSVCSFTEFRDTCLATLGSSNSSNPEKIFQLSLTVVLNSLQRISAFPGEFANRTNDPLVKEALAVCGGVLNDAVESLHDTVSASQDKNSNIVARVDDLRTWLSAVLTDQDTCADALAEAGADFSGEVALLMKNSTELASNSLAIVSRVLGAIGDFKLPGHRRLLGSDIPAWVDRRALQAAVRPDVTVSASGGGDVRTIKEAVARIPKKSLRRFVIYVKAGVYVENIVLEKSLWNVMMYGDGKNTTVISGRKNFVDGTPTFSTATFAVVGKGFIARDIGFRNTAGAAKHQAVALRSGSDMSVFYRCSFDAFQDTLYAHSNRQFYRDCDITGTIDFIFGNSAVVFQNCNILPRQPLANQFVTITAQGKKDPNQNTGISIQRCTMSPLDRLTAATYLGRPWKEFSTTVVMETSIGSFLNPKGWIPWVTNVDPPKTIVYGEYRNTGPGAKTVGRVKWAGYKPSMMAAEAAKYTVGSFIMGQSWLPATTVKFDLK